MGKPRSAMPPDPATIGMPSGPAPAYSFGPRGGYGFEVTRYYYPSTSSSSSSYQPYRSDDTGYGFVTGLIIGSMF